MYWSRVYDLSIQKILTFLIQWFLSRSQRHQSYFHLVSYFNHFHLQEGVTFCINELHVSCAEMMYRKKVGMWIVSVIIKMVYKRMNPDTRWKEKFTCWYIRGRKNTVDVCSCGEHSIWKHSQVNYYYATEYFYCIYLIRYFDYHRNKASIEQIYNITAYTDI